MFFTGLYCWKMYVDWEHYSNEGIFDIANSLLNDDNSPWGRYLL